MWNLLTILRTVVPIVCTRLRFLKKLTVLPGKHDGKMRDDILGQNKSIYRVCVCVWECHYMIKINCLIIICLPRKQANDVVIYR